MKQKFLISHQLVSYQHSLALGCPLLFLDEDHMTLSTCENTCSDEHVHEKEKKGSCVYCPKPMRGFFHIFSLLFSEIKPFLVLLIA